MAYSLREFVYFLRKEASTSTVEGKVCALHEMNTKSTVYFVNYFK
ncbi:MAG: hypothetical protein ACI8RD_006020 [Bacillariaceae sp.]|jgi:hypothetical protein